MNLQINSYPVVVLDIERDLVEFLGELAEPRNDTSMYSKDEIMIATLRGLHFERYRNEAKETLMFDMVTQYQPVFDSNHDIQRMNDVVAKYMDAVHFHLRECGMYDRDGELQYTFGGWADPYSPYLIHASQIRKFSKAAPLRVESQYEFEREHNHSYHWNPARYLQKDRGAVAADHLA